MTKSSLTDVTIISPNTSGLRSARTSKLTVHHMAGDLTVEGCGGVFANPDRQASSNYGVGSDGRIGCYLEEEYHPWTSANWANDEVAVTLEVADYDTDAWSPSTKAYNATVALCADICQRHGIEPSYDGTPDATFTEHRMFAATSCPGPWWHERMPQFVQDVKNAMNGGFSMPIECILHPDESGMLFHVSGNSIEYIPHPDCVTALQDVAEACGQDIPYIDLGTKEAPWGWRFFQACGQGELYERMVEGKQSDPFKPTQEPAQEPDGEPIMGASEASAAQMVACYNDKGKPYPAIYAEKGAPTIADFCEIVMDESNAEGVRAEVVFAQAMHETGWLQFGGDVSPEQCNFAGIGATGGVPGNSFEDVRQGIRAQVQHLKAYASTDELVHECVDPRFHYVQRGIAPTVEELGGRWAVGSHYGERIIAIMDYMLSQEVPEPEPEPEPERAEKLRYCIGVLNELLEECE